MGRLGCLLILAALGGITVGVRTLMTASRATAEPIRLTLAELTDRQITANPHVIIDDIFPCSFDAIIGRSRRKSAAWMPAIKATPEFTLALKEWTDRKGSIDSFPRQPNVRLLIKCSDTSDQHLLSLMGKTSVRGMLVENDIGIVKGAAMQKNYPGLVASRCIVLHEGASPPGAMDSLGTFGLAGALLVGGFLLLLVPRRNKLTPLGSTPPIVASVNAGKR